MSKDFDWNETTVARLRQLWAEGLSASKIADIMGATRNAIIGKAHRLMLPPRESPIKAAGSGVPRAPRPRAPRLADLMLVAPAPAIIARPAVPLVLSPPEVLLAPAEPAVEAEAPEDAPPPVHGHGCLWPMWWHDERPTHVYCDAPRSRLDTSYCAQHHRKAYTTPEQRKIAQANLAKARVTHAIRTSAATRPWMTHQAEAAQ